MDNWFDELGEFEEPEFDDDAGYGETVPGRFRFLGDVIKSLPATFDRWLAGASERLTNTFWGALGDLIEDVRDAYHDADNWLRQKFVTYWGYMRGLPFTVEEYSQARVDRLLAEGFETRKVFADVSDIREYVRKAQHLEWFALIDEDGLYHLFVRGSQ